MNYTIWYKRALGDRAVSYTIWYKVDSSRRRQVIQYGIKGEVL